VSRRALASVLALAALVAAPAAHGQASPPPSGGTPFGPLPPAQQQQAPTQTTPAPSKTTQTSQNDSGPSLLGIGGLLVLGVLVIFMIGWFILRDARRSLPKHARRQPRRAKAKAKAKAKAQAEAVSTAAGGRRPPPRPPRKAKAAHARRNKRRSRRRPR
jgi:hypothetical protein